MHFSCRFFKQISHHKNSFDLEFFLYDVCSNIVKRDRQVIVVSLCVIVFTQYQLQKGIKPLNRKSIQLKKKKKTQMSNDLQTHAHAHRHRHLDSCVISHTNKFAHGLCYAVYNTYSLVHSYVRITVKN